MDKTIRSVSCHFVQIIIIKRKIILYYKSIIISWRNFPNVLVKIYNLTNFLSASVKIL